MCFVSQREFSCFVELESSFDSCLVTRISNGKIKVNFLKNKVKSGL